MNTAQRVEKKMAEHGKEGNIGHTVRLYHAIASVNHLQVKEHSERVALTAEEVATMLGEDARAAFLGGMLHDIGKITLPGEFFKDHGEITPEQYEVIKTHAENGFKILEYLHPFSALCAGLHHAVYEGGYGITAENVPLYLGENTMGKVTKISVIISVCDFIDAFTHRKTRIMNAGTNTKTLDQLLAEKYLKHLDIVSAALSLRQ